MALFRTNLFLKALLVAVGLGAGLSAAAPAQAQSDQLPQVSDEISDLLNNSLRPANEASNWDKALSIIKEGLTKVEPGSYDEALLYQIQAQTYFQKNDQVNALRALEHGLAIDDKHHYYPEKTRQEMRYFVAQITFNEASSTKDLQRQTELYGRASQALEVWLKDAKNFTTDQLYFISLLYFYQSQPSTEPTHAKEKGTNFPLMEKALLWTEKSLRSTTRPRDNLYQLKLAELFQLGRFKEGAELLELLVKQKPDSRNFWQQLANTYLQLGIAAAEKHEDQASFSYNLRAALTIERAQQLGLMNTAKDNYNLVSIYFNLAQYSEACRLLDQGLRNNTIERTRSNYELLANSYQQMNREFKAISTLDEAAKIFPTSGQIEYQIAQIYFTIDKIKEAFAHMKACIAKGGTEKPHIAWLFYAYLALDLKEYDEALKAATQAAQYPEAKKEAKQMEEAIKATIQDRENRLQAQS
ncbi:MAG: hypothetical protein PHE83_07035 [Opitutaceae bacterium]|nr:hypothetical protein [Opitutaceae bacterium]